MACFYTKLHISASNGSLNIAVKSTTEYLFICLFTSDYIASDDRIINE
jgi:hypothetical protein